MSKKLVVVMLLLSFAVAVPLAMAQDTGARKEVYTSPTMDEKIDQIKNPTSWLSWGFDQRNREIYAKNFLWLDNDSRAPANEWHFQRFRSRLWAKFMPFEDIDINTRLVWEWRNYCKPDADLRSGPIEWDEALFDQMNVTWRNVFDMPLTAVVGRQDIIFGNGWLVLDGTPFDGSRTIFFDAVRLTYQLDEATTVDGIYLDQQNEADKTIEPFNDQERAGGLMEQDERGAILYLTNKSWVPDAEVSSYFIWKHDKNVPGVAGSNDSEIYTAGARIAGAFDANWKYRAEFAQETGKKNFERLCAFGFNSRLSYLMNDSWKNDFHVGYEYLSGDDPDTDTNEAFDPLWGRWPQWSELYIYTYATETRIAETTNLHRIQFGWDSDPTDKIHLCNEYNLVFADENTRGGAGGVDESGCFRGQLLATKMIYKFNKHLSGHLWGEYFFPGNYYTDDRNDAAVFLRYELTLTF